MGIAVLFGNYVLLGIFYQFLREYRISSNDKNFNIKLYNQNCLINVVNNCVY